LEYDLSTMTFEQRIERIKILESALATARSPQEAESIAYEIYRLKTEK